jgi:hypothetical protein
MNEEEFDASFPLRPFGTADVARADAEARRSSVLARALWGRTSADLQRQLLASHPEIPAGFDLADFHRLYRNARSILKVFADPLRPSLLHLAQSSPVICVGIQSFTAWEARCEIVRRAIDYLENR